MEAAQPLVVRVAEFRRNDGLRQVPSDGFDASPPERGFCLRVPGHDHPVGIDADEGVVRRVDHEPGTRFAFGELHQRLAPLFVRHGYGNQVADGHGEVLLVHGPEPGSAHVLRTEHAEYLIVVSQRNVEHRADAVRPKVRLEEFT
jgi:hypothetical protein